MSNNKLSVIKQISDESGSGSLSMIRIQLGLKVRSRHLDIYTLESLNDADSDLFLYMSNNKFSVIKQISDESGSGSLIMIRVQLGLRVGSRHLEIYILESIIELLSSYICLIAIKQI